MIKVRGFTLIEIIMVVAIMAIVAAILGPFLARPFEAYNALAQRTTLVNQLNSAMQQMEKDLQNSVPNTVRANSTSMEMMNTVNFGRYRLSNALDNDATLTTDNLANALAPTLLDNSFNLFGNIAATIDPTTLGRNIWAVTNNIQAQNFYDAFNGLAAGVVRQIDSAVAANGGTETRIRLPAAFKFDVFGAGSPNKRMYFTDGAVLYVCSGQNAGGAGTITRFTLNDPAAGADPSVAPANGGVVLLNNVSACNFNYSDYAVGNATMTINITLESGQQTARLMQQVQVPNAP